MENGGNDDDDGCDYKIHECDWFGSSHREQSPVLGFFTKDEGNSNTKTTKPCHISRKSYIVVQRTINYMASKTYSKQHFCHVWHVISSSRQHHSCEKQLAMKSTCQSNSSRYGAYLRHATLKLAQCRYRRAAGACN